MPCLVAAEGSLAVVDTPSRHAAAPLEVTEARPRHVHPEGGHALERTTGEEPRPPALRGPSLAVVYKLGAAA